VRPEDIITTKTEIPALLRAYEANQKLLQMQDETLKATVNEVGKAS